MNVKKLLFTALTGCILFSCDSDDKVTNTVQENVETGAVLRTIEIIENSIPIGMENGQTIITGTAQLSIVIEEQDEQEGALLQSVDVYTSFTDGSPDTGDTSMAVTEEVFLGNIPVDLFSDGPFGLPRLEFTLEATELLSAVNLTPEAIFGGDTFTTRFALNLSDGRTFSSDNAGGIITGGFFNSPFQYITPVVCNLATDSFVGNYLIEEITPYVDGPTFADGTVVEVSVGNTDTERLFFTPNYPDYCSTPNDFNFLFVCGEIIVPIQESNCACNTGADFFGPTDTPENYDANDDSVFFVTFENDVQSDCAPPEITTYKFTKQ
ncbi:hypothetical protein [uncultured Dokdonia sp.]|uniref:hypothetical protein n=1 Tax=uncultured Dokdonia sp. TaxID=575653 RepID=UPI002618FA15|nr:hypothetical protein [uncultured Dokdonia sp.]